MRRFLLCTLTALVLFIILQLSLMRHPALSAIASVSEGTTSTQSNQPIDQPAGSSGVLFIENVGQFDDGARFQVPASGAEFEEFNSIVTNAGDESEFLTISSTKAMAPQSLNQDRDGMTWHKRSHIPQFGVDLVGCNANDGFGECDGYNGDTVCSTPLPILCLKKEGLANPGLNAGFYNGWTGGRIGLTWPIAGNQLTGIQDATLLCEHFVGPGYTIGEHHDGGGGWNWYAYGNVDDSTSFWTYINNQDANCWGYGAGAPAQPGALDRLLANITMLTISKSGPATVLAGDPVTYTLAISNSGQLTATNLVITDTLPTGANYVSGGTLAGNVVSWTLPTLPPTSTISVQFVVTATQTITNSDYAVTADGGHSATGSTSVTTVVTPSMCSCQIDLDNNSHTCQGIPAITFVNGPSNNQAVVKINLDPNAYGHTQAQFDVEYGGQPQGWTVNIGDASTNNGWGGDAGLTSNAAEMQILNTTLDLYSNVLPGYNSVTLDGHLHLARVENAVSQGDIISLKVKDEYLKWHSPSVSGDFDSPYLYTLNGQATLYGPVNYDIYAGFNRTIGSAARNGSGVSKVNISLCAKAELDISKSAPATASASDPITYTLAISNSGQLTATNLIVTDTLPTNASYVSGGTLVGNVVSWTLPTLSPTSTTSVQFVVTATQTITNSNYAVTADGGHSATGSTSVTTIVTTLCPGSICHVAKSGSDTTGDGSATNPFLTIQHAIDVSTDSYTVLVHPGTYVENINFNGKNITVKSTDGPDSTIIDGNQNGSVVTFENGEDSALLEGLTLTNGNGTYSDPTGYPPTSGFLHRGGGMFINLSNPNIVNVKILNNSAELGGGIYSLRSAPAITNTVISGNSSNSHGGGLYYESHSVRYPTLTNVLISGNSAPKGAGVAVNYSTRATLTHVTISGNTATTSGGAIWRGNASNVTVSNSVIWGNTPAAIHWDGGTSHTSQIDYSLVEGAGSGTLITWGSGNLNVNPLFVGSGDYRLSNSSPAIDVGTSTGMPNYDINGVTRPQGSGWDMGAYEYQNSPSGSLLAIYALAFDTLPATDLSWAYSDVMKGLLAATANDANKRAIVLVDMPGADNTLVYELQGGNETLISTSGLPDTSGNLSSAIHEYDMTDGATLGGFLLWARNTYSADKTTFSYVGHGAPLVPETDFKPIFDPNAPPPAGSPAHLFPLPTRKDANPSFTDVTPNAKILSVYQLSEALRIGTNGGANPFDVADLVHCFASSIEEYVALYPYADAMTGSPNYAFFAEEMLGEALDAINYSTDAHTIADTIIKEYDSAIETYDDTSTLGDEHPRILVAVDSDKILGIKQKWNEVSYYLWQNFNKTKIENAYLNSAHYDTTYCLDEHGTQDWELASPDAVVDLKKFANQLKQEFGSPVTVPVNTLELLIDDAIISRYKANGQPWFANVTPQPTWNFDNHSGIGIYADFVGTPIGTKTHLSWHSHFYTDTVTIDNPHPYAFLQGDFAGINWGDVFNRFWEGSSNLETDACLPKFPPLPGTGELAVTKIVFPRVASVTDNSPVQITAAISTAHAAVHTTVAFTVTQSSTTVFSDVVHIPGLLLTGTHPVNASKLWSPALANPAVAEPFTLEVMVDHDNHISETNELDNVLTMSNVVAPAPANPRPIITATIPNNLQWITDTTASLHVVQAPSTQPPPVQTVEVQVYQYVAGSAPNTQVPILLNSQTFSSVSLPQALNVSLSGLTPGPVVLHVWGWSTGGVTVYPSIVKFNYIPPNTALPTGEQHHFLFNANAGDTLEFNLNALSGDPNMFLWLPTNFGVPTFRATVVGSDYLTPSAPIRGEYLLSVYGQSSGTYTLTTKRNGVPYARRAARANNPNAYVPENRATFMEPIPDAPEIEEPVTPTPTPTAVPPT
ncbi:MAG: choice-of-anchor Q domain-containing protein, partial [Ardenticatenaceae bacterium]